MGTNGPPFGPNASHDIGGLPTGGTVSEASLFSRPKGNMTGGFTAGTECVHTHEWAIDSESYTANQKASPRAPATVSGRTRAAHTRGHRDHRHCQ